MLELKTSINSRKNSVGKINFLSRDKSKILESYPMHSFNKNLWNIWQSATSGDTFIGIPTIGGGSQTVQFDIVELSSKSVAGADYKGIIVGTGTTAAAIDDTSLASMITHGTGAGQLEYGVGSGTVLSNGKELQLTREVINNSGSNITINEVGVCISDVTSDSEFITDPILIVRDVLDSPVTISNGGSRIISITFGMSDGTQNMKMLIANVYNQADSVQCFEIDGSSSSLRELEELMLGLNAGELNSLAAGTGNTAFTETDLDLDNRITHGTNAGQLEYGATSVSGFTVDTDNNKVSFNLFRQVNNNSGADITISEVGWISGRFSDSYLLNRKVLNTPVTVANGDFELLKWVFEYSM